MYYLKRGRKNLLIIRPELNMFIVITFQNNLKVPVMQ